MITTSSAPGMISGADEYPATTTQGKTVMAKQVPQTKDIVITSSCVVEGRKVKEDTKLTLNRVDADYLISCRKAVLASDYKGKPKKETGTTGS
jgi:hypothetical protein